MATASKSQTRLETVEGGNGENGKRTVWIPGVKLHAPLSSEAKNPRGFSVIQPPSQERGRKVSTEVARKGK